MISLTDAHCHLADAKLRGDVARVLARAAAAGVERIVSVGAIGPLDTDRLTVEIAERHRGVFAAVGVHPHDARDCDRERIGQLRELARSPRVVAIGESGLDFHYLHSAREAQEDALRRHLELAAELALPIVIHCRNAEQRLAAIVREAGLPGAGGVVHCFSGSAGAAREFLALGFYLSFSGILTFKNPGALREAARVVPADRLLIETDAPYLAPEPHRGRRNEPCYVGLTLSKLAELRGASPAQLGSQIAANAERLFSLA